MEKSTFTLRLRQLPKPEYKLMKALVKSLSLKDESELFAIALRLLYEVSLYDNGRGERWIIQVINTFRSSLDKEREYDV